jgi:hypothetical protein
MKTRAVLLVLTLSAACVLSASWLFVTASPADAAKDLCLEAVDAMYNDCRLKFELNGEVFTFGETVEACRADSSDRKFCWTSCARNNTDCGEMADCIDYCFNGQLTCEFTVQFIYDGCTMDLYSRDDFDVIWTRDDALADCEADGDELWDCYHGCTRENWNLCSDLGECTTECVRDFGDDDDESPDDTDDDTSPASDPGEPIENVDGSACGI